MTFIKLDTSSFSLRNRVDCFKTESFNGEAVINLVLRTFLGEILGTRLPVSRDLLLVREATNYLSFSRDLVSAAMSYELL